MARKMYVQYTPIAPLNILGTIDATVVSDTAPDHSNQLVMGEDTVAIPGFLVDIVLLGLIPI